MTGRMKLPCFAAAFAASACVAPAVCAQALSLTYNLDRAASAVAKRIGPVVHRCAGLNWAASLAAGCVQEARAHADTAATPAPAQETRRDSAPAARADAAESYSGNVESGATSALPNLRAAPADRVVRVMGGKDALTANARAVDFMFRFGTKYRMRSGDEGWEVYKFVDVTQENRLSASRLKNIGVELLVPFQ